MQQLLEPETEQEDISKESGKLEHRLTTFQSSALPCST